MLFMCYCISFSIPKLNGWGKSGQVFLEEHRQVQTLLKCMILFFSESVDDARAYIRPKSTSIYEIRNVQFLPIVVISFFSMSTFPMALFLP